MRSWSCLVQGIETLLMQDGRHGLEPSMKPRRSWPLRQGSDGIFR